MTITSDSSQETSVLKQTKKFEDEGYHHSFIAEHGGLRCTRTNEFFFPEDLRIVDMARFEGASDPDDMSVMYVVETDNGTKGILQDAFGLYASTMLGEILAKIRDTRKSLGQTTPHHP